MRFERAGWALPFGKVKIGTWEIARQNAEPERRSEHGRRRLGLGRGGMMCVCVCV